MHPSHYYTVLSNPSNPLSAMSEHKTNNSAATFTYAVLLNDNISVVELAYSYCYTTPTCTQLIQYSKGAGRKQICAAVILLLSLYCNIGSLTEARACALCGYGPFGVYNMNVNVSGQFIEVPLHLIVTNSMLTPLAVRIVNDILRLLFKCDFFSTG